MRVPEKGNVCGDGKAECEVIALQEADIVPATKTWETPPIQEDLLLIDKSTYLDMTCIALWPASFALTDALRKHYNTPDKLSIVIATGTLTLAYQ